MATPKTESEIETQRIKREVEYRFNPLKNIGPEKLLSILEAFGNDEFQRAARVMDTIERRDIQTRTVAPKRKRAPANMPWEILTVDESPLATRQKEDLEALYNNLTWRHGLNRHRRGSVAKMLRAMMDAVSKGFAVHELLWRPITANGRQAYTIETVFVPLWFFTGQWGELQYLEQDYQDTGRPLEDGGWLVADGDGLMEPTSIAWMYKNLTLKDWLILSEKFGWPWIHGKTDARIDTPEWNQMAGAMQGLSRDAQILTNKAAEITFHNVGSAGNAPQASLVEYMDRAISALWRGGDLSTMSRGDGLGSNPQQEENQDIEAEDCLMLSEACNEYIDKWAIRYIYGEDAPVLAYFSTHPKDRVDTVRELNKWQTAVSMGIPVSIRDWRERFGLPAPAEGEDIIDPPSQMPMPGGENFLTAANASPMSTEDKYRKKALQMMTDARRADWQPILDALQSLDDARDPGAYRQALIDVKEELAQLAPDPTSSHFAKTLQNILAPALLSGAVETYEKAKS
ncbi:MAG: DUF935 family protein [Opitutales bacterium]|nr:DUF935 family protein [Opitutales bacterium]